MPFTFSHPAIILSLNFLPKKWFSLTGLIIGSVTPDFEYFIRMKVQSIYSHTLSGIFWFDLPLGLLLAFIFHNIVRNSLFLNLPKIIKSKILFFTEFNWNRYFKTNWIVVIISLLIGITSHLFWDNFTHEHGYFVNQISELRNTISILEFKIPFWKIAQHVSSLIGMLIIIVSLFKLPVNKIQNSSFDKRYWSVFLLFSLLILIIRFASGLHFQAYGNIIVSAIAAIIFSSILTPLFLKLKTKS